MFISIKLAQAALKYDYFITIELIRRKLNIICRFAVPVILLFISLDLDGKP